MHNEGVVMSDEDNKPDLEKPRSETSNTSKASIEIPGPIGLQLKQSYDRLLAEPLPEKFNDLLAQLASASEKGK